MNGYYPRDLDCAKFLGMWGCRNGGHDMSRFGFRNFLYRWVSASVLVLGTFNPSGWSFYHLIAPGIDKHEVFNDVDISIKILLAILLAVLYVIFLRATWRSIGIIGLILAAGFVGTVAWVLVNAEIINLDSWSSSTYILEVMLATVLAIGLSWSHIRRRVSGQADIDDLGDDF